MRPAAVVALAVLALAGCGGGDDEVRTGADAAPATRLAVEVRPAPGEPPRRGGLTCDGSAADGTGFLADRPDDACAAVLSRDGRRRLVDGPAADRLCTQVYGGPEEATVTGTLEGERVDTSFHRKDGCGVGEWDEMKALLGAAGTAAARPAS